MSFSEHLKKISQPIWDAQFTHPFVKGLGDGTLPSQKFKFYILQDALFLFELARLFAAAARKAMDTETMAHLAKLVSDTIVVERSLHQDYGKAWGMTEAEMAATPMAPTNYAYTRHLLHVAETGSQAEITVASLPCAWIYCDVGTHLLGSGRPPENHPYTNWLNLYASPEFAEVAHWMRERVDGWVKNAGEEEKQRMASHFVISSRYEYMFWEMAWKEEKWPI
jgi:thiaminase (transcriptional activator TenA)